MTFESVSGVIFSNDRLFVLLVERRDVPVWVLPGGGVERGETTEHATVREILEETGFHVKIIRLAGEYQPINRLTRPTLLYECSILSGEPTPSSETKAVQFFPISALPKMPPPYAEWILEALTQKTTVHKSIDSVTYASLVKNLILHPCLVIRFLLSRMGLPINR